MMTKILKAKPVIKKIYAELKTKIEKFQIKPKLALLAVGKDPASQFYVKNIIKKAKKIGIIVDLITFPVNVKETTLLKKIDSLNNDDEIAGIMIQKPLPKHIDEHKLILTLSPLKDVDGFHPLNIGNLVINKDSFIPCTAAAVIEMLNYYKIFPQNKNIVIIGRSNIVGKPLANLLLRKSKLGNATITVCHSKTINVKQHASKADILIAALGKARYVNKNMIKKNAVIIDVGINQVSENSKTKYVGDVDYKDCFDKAAAITPVPGGIGSVTTAVLMKNIVKAYKNINNS